MDKFIQEVIEGVTGGKSAAYYFVGFFFSGIGIYLSWYHSSKKRNPASPNTPEKFSTTFLVWDNLPKGIAITLVMYLLLLTLPLNEVWAKLSVGVTVSIALDKVLDWLMTKSEWLYNLLSQDRTKWPEKPKEGK